MMATGWIMPLIRFAIFQKDGGPLPDDAEILSATLSVYKINAYGFALQAKRCTTSWKYEEVTWNSGSKGTAWYTPGGDASDQAASKTTSPWEPCWFDADVTEGLRQSQKEAKDFGWFLYCDQNNIVNLASSRNKDQSLHPKLKIKVRTTAMK